MYKIFIDTSKREEKIVRLYKSENGKEALIFEKKGDIDIIWEINNILTTHSITLQDIGGFDYYKGPGSFTGLKMGATVINMLNWLTNKKSIKELQMPDYGSEPNIQKSAIN